MANKDPIWLIDKFKPIFTGIIQDIFNLVKDINIKYITFEDISQYVLYPPSEKLNTFIGDELYECDPNELNTLKKLIKNFDQSKESYGFRSDGEDFNREDVNNVTKKEMLQILRNVIKEFNLDIDINDILFELSNIPRNVYYNLDIPYNNEDKSPKRGWKRSLSKYDPSKAHLLSPVKPTIANYAPVLLNDVYSQGLLWVLVMTEKLYYDNSCLLCYQLWTTPDKFKNTLILNTQEIFLNEYLKTWTNIQELGEGNFGVVLKFNDPVKERTDCVKYIYCNDHAFLDKLDFITERNYLIRASNSPLVVRILHSFQLQDLKGSFLVMEYCITDLRKVLEAIFEESEISYFTKLDESNYRYLKYQYGEISSTCESDIRMIICVYILELFVILDHLAKCNIVHCDIKPENIMISDRLHLKIGDLGLVNNTYHIYEDNRRKFFNVDEIIEQQMNKYQKKPKGTPLYSDPEICYRRIGQDYVLNDSLYEYEGTYDIAHEDYSLNFISDLWSMGMIAAELMLLGYNIFDAKHKGYYELIHLPVEAIETPEYCIVLFAIVPQFQKFIDPGFVKMSNRLLGKLPNFIASILKYRSARCPEYLKTKRILFYSRKEVFKCIDINKVENIDIFKKYEISSANVFLVDIPDSFRYFVSPPETEDDYDDFDDLALTLKYRDGKAGCKYMQLQPGMNLRFDAS